MATETNDHSVRCCCQRRRRPFLSGYRRLCEPRDMRFRQAHPGWRRAWHTPARRFRSPTEATSIEVFPSLSDPGAATVAGKSSDPIGRLARMSELPVDDHHEVVHLGDQTAVIVPLEEYRHLKEAAEVARVETGFAIGAAGFLAREAAGTPSTCRVKRRAAGCGCPSRELRGHLRGSVHRLGCGFMRDDAQDVVALFADVDQLAGKPRPETSSGGMGHYLVS